MSKKNVVTTSFVGLLSSVLAFLGIVSCCGFPLIAAFLAWFGIGVSQLSFLSEYKYLFTGMAVLALLYGFYTIYFKKAKASKESSCCSSKVEKNTEESNCCTFSVNYNLLSKVMLWFGVIAVTASLIMGDGDTESSNVKSNCCTEEISEPVNQVQSTDSISTPKPTCCSEPEQVITTMKKTSCCSK